MAGEKPFPPLPDPFSVTPTAGACGCCSLDVEEGDCKYPALLAAAKAVLRTADQPSSDGITEVRQAPLDALRRAVEEAEK